MESIRGHVIGTNAHVI